MTFAGKLIKIIMTNEISQTHKDKYCLFSFYVNPDLYMWVWGGGCGDIHVGQEGRKGTRRREGEISVGGEGKAT